MALKIILPKSYLRTPIDVLCPLFLSLGGKADVLRIPYMAAAMMTQRMREEEEKGPNLISQENHNWLGSRACGDFCLG